MTSTCRGKASVELKNLFRTDGGPLIVTDEAEDALIHKRFEGVIA